MLNNHDRLRIWFFPQEHLRRPTKNLLKIEKNIQTGSKQTQKKIQTKKHQQKNIILLLNMDLTIRLMI